MTATGRQNPSVRRFTESQLADPAQHLRLLNDLATDTGNALAQVRPFVVREVVVTIADPVESATLENSWAAVAGYATPGYWKDADGLVRLRGAVDGGTYGASAILTLPAGFRPANAVSVPVVQTNATFEPAGRLDIATTGAVTAPDITSIQTGTSTFLSLEGVSFLAADRTPATRIAAALNVNTQGLPGAPNAVSVVSCRSTVTTDAKAAPSIAWQPNGTFVRIVDVTGLAPGTYTLRLLITSG